MADSIPHSAKTLQIMKKAEVDKEIKQLRQTASDAKKRIKELKADNTVVKDIVTWQEIQKLKDKMLKELQSIEGCKTWNLTKMVKAPTFFNYQNPNNAMEKAIDDTADWVVKYRKRTDSVAPLIEAAEKTHIKMAKKLFGRIKKRNKKANDKNGNTGTTTKTKDARGVGIV